MRQRLRTGFVGTEPLEERGFRPTLAQAYDTRTEARKIYKDLLKNAKDLRKAFLEERAKAEALASNGDKEKILKRIINSEESIEDFNLLRRLMGKSYYGGLQTLLVPNGQVDEEYRRKNDNNWNEVVSASLWSGDLRVSSS